MKYGPVYKHAKNGIEVEFRSACADEAQLEIDYLKQVCGESLFMLSEPDEIKFTADGERAFLDSYEASDRALMLNAYIDGKLIGNGSFSAVSGANRMAHRATLGIALFKEYTGMGIGGLLLSILLEEAARCGFESMELDVYSSNEHAIRLYEKLGFRTCGRIPNAVKYKDGSYTDEIKMQKALK